jgi:hypothetical protein
VAAKAEEIVEHVVLVLVDVAALPEAVAPFGQLSGKAGQPAELAQPRRRGPAADDLQRQRSGERPRGDRDPFAAEIEARAVAVARAPHAITPAGEQPWHRRAVALGNAALGEHLGRAVGPRVVAIGAELDVATGLVQPRMMAQPEAHQALVGAALPVQAESQRIILGRQRQRHPLVGCQLDRQTRDPASVEAQSEHDPVLVESDRRRGHRALDGRALLAGEHALGELQELVADLSVDGPRAARAQQRPPGPADDEPERPEGHLHPQRGRLQHHLADTLGHIHVLKVLGPDDAPCVRSRNGH